MKIKNQIIIALGVLCALAVQPVHAAGQIQQLVNPGTATTNVNFIIANQTIKYNLTGLSTNDSRYASTQSTAPVINARDARQLSIAVSMNDTATNASTETFTLYCSNDQVSWYAPSTVGVLGVDNFTVSIANFDYSTTNLMFGTNIDTAGWPLWSIGKIQHSGSTGVLTNLSIKAFTKSGGL